jgi:hypothetical protein
MESSILNYLKKNENTIYSARTLAKKTNYKKKHVYKCLVNLLGNSNIIKVKPIMIGSRHHRRLSLFTYQSS